MADVYAPTRRADKVADWLELTALARGTSVGSDTLHELGAPLRYRPADVALALATVKRRAALLGDAYPFKIANGIAALPIAKHRAWTALLLMSVESPLRPTMSIADAAGHLERLTAEALTSLYGPGTSAVRFAWPSEDGRPSDFPEAIRWLAARLNVPIGSAYRPPYNKDGGVDVVAWRPFPDGRSGFPVLLTQCTLERDYRHKAADIDLRVWSGWLSLDIDPSTALAIPDVVPSGEEWAALAARTVILDRIRLAALLGGSEAERPRLQPVAIWTEQQLAVLSESQ